MSECEPAHGAWPRGLARGCDPLLLASRALRGNRPRRVPGMAMVAMALALATSAIAQPTAPLGLAQAQALALQQSLAVPAQQATAQAAQARALAAQRRPDPVLRLGLDNVPVEGGSEHLLTREPTTARSIAIAQALPTAAKRSARSGVFLSEADRARAEVERETRAVWLDSGLAWLVLRAEQQRLTTLDAQRQQAARLHLAAQAAYRAAQGTQTEVFAARAAQARLDDEHLRAQQDLAQARTTLQRWIGTAADAPLADLPDWTGAAWAEQPAAALVQIDADLRVAAAQEAVAAAAAVAASQDRQADWSVDLRFAQRGPRFDNMVSLGLSIPLRWGPDTAQERELAARLAQQRAAQARHEDTRRERLAEVQRWQQRWRIGLARLRLHDEQRAPLAQAQVQAALGAYRAGTGSLAAVLAAQQAELALQLERVQLELAAASDGLRLHTLSRPGATSPSPLSAEPELQP